MGATRAEIQSYSPVSTPNSEAAAIATMPSIEGSPNDGVFAHIHESLRVSLVLLPILFLFSFLIFWNLDVPSVDTKDEYLHMSAAQSLWQRRDGIVPLIDGQRYLHKPPLKMFATFIPLSLFGESNFTYRFLDALSGMGLAVVIFLFSMRLFNSLPAAAFAALSLATCQSVFFVHGFRYCSQDAPLLFLLTFGLVFGYLAAIDAPGRLRNAIISGIFFAFAALTKSVAAGVAGLILVPFWFLVRRAWQGKSRTEIIRTALALFAPPVALFGLYLSYIIHYYRSAYGTLVKYEVVERASEGFHNASDWMYYLHRFFLDGTVFPRELLSLALVWGGWQAFSRRNSFETKLAYRFLLLWAVVPFLFYSAIPSRLAWYVDPSLPPLAIICGSFLGALFSYLPVAFQKYRSSAQLAAFLPLLLLTFLLYRCGENIVRTAEEVLNPPKSTPANLIANDVLKYRRTHPDAKLYLANTAKTTKHDRLYWRMAHPNHRAAVPVRRQEEIVKHLDERDVFIVADEPFTRQLLELRKVRALRYEDQGIRDGVWVLAYGDEFSSPNFWPSVKTYSFANPTEFASFGLARRSRMGRHMVAWALNKNASILLPGDTAIERFGANLEMVLTAPATVPPLGTKVSILLNGQVLGDFEPKVFDLRPVTFHVDSETWQAEYNVIRFRTTFANPTDRDRFPKSFGIKQFSIQFAQAIAK